MHREELRDQLLAPILQWIRLGRQTSQLMVASLEVIGERSNGLLRGATLRDSHDWNEMGLMTREKVEIPLEAVGAMASALQSEVQQFLTQISEATLAVASSSLTLASSRNPEDFSARQAALCSSLLSVALSWYQLSGRTAAVAEQSLRPILRQVRDNSQRLRARERFLAQGKA